MNKIKIEINNKKYEIINDELVLYLTRTGTQRFVLKSQEVMEYD